MHTQLASLELLEEAGIMCAAQPRACSSFVQCVPLSATIRPILAEPWLSAISCQSIALHKPHTVGRRCCILVSTGNNNDPLTLALLPCATHSVNLCIAAVLQLFVARLADESALSSNCHWHCCSAQAHLFGTVCEGLCHCRRDRLLGRHVTGAVVSACWKHRHHRSCMDSLHGGRWQD